jgi:hypothetical protein
VTNYDRIAKDLPGHRWLIETAARSGDVEFFIKLGEAIEDLSGGVNRGKSSGVERASSPSQNKGGSNE